MICPEKEGDRDKKTREKKQRKKKREKQLK